jgi:hypothetical protein
MSESAFELCYNFIYIFTYDFQPLIYVLISYEARILQSDWLVTRV